MWKKLFLGLGIVLFFAAAIAGAYWLWHPTSLLPVPQQAAQLEPVGELPLNTQVLLYPIKDGLISAGYQNPTYAQKMGFLHYGFDLTYSTQGQTDIVASGTGVVLGTESCQNSVGNIIVIRYDNVFNPDTKQTLVVIARYYHLLSLAVAKGDIVAAGQVLGVIDTQHQWYNHVHMELDTSHALPFNTPQVAEVTSKLLNRFPATGDSFLEPVAILAVGNGQHIAAYPGSEYCEEKDKPRFGWLG